MASSQYRGVFFEQSRSLYTAQFYHKGGKKVIKRFASERAAARWRDAKAREQCRRLGAGKLTFTTPYNFPLPGEKSGIYSTIVANNKEPRLIFMKDEINHMNDSGNKSKDGVGQHQQLQQKDRERLENRNSIPNAKGNEIQQNHFLPMRMRTVSMPHMSNPPPTTSSSLQMLQQEIQNDNSNNINDVPYQRSSSKSFSMESISSKATLDDIPENVVASLVKTVHPSTSSIFAASGGSMVKVDKKKQHSITNRTPHPRKRRRRANTMTNASVSFAETTIFSSNKKIRSSSLAQSFEAEQLAIDLALSAASLPSTAPKIFASSSPVKDSVVSSIQLLSWAAILEDQHSSTKKSLKSKKKQNKDI